MSDAITGSLELERQLSEAIDNLFEVARRYDFSGAEGLTYLATTYTDKKFFGLSWTERKENLTYSLTYHLHDGSEFENGLVLAVEGTFIQIPPSYTCEWPFSTQHPPASEDLIRQINIAASRIAL